MIEIAYLRRRARVRGWFAGLDASEPVPAPAPTLSEAIARVTQMRLDADDAARFLARRDPQRAVRWTGVDSLEVFAFGAFEGPRPSVRLDSRAWVTPPHDGVSHGREAARNRGRMGR